MGSSTSTDTEGQSSFGCCAAAFGPKRIVVVGAPRSGVTTVAMSLRPKRDVFYDAAVHGNVLPSIRLDATLPPFRHDGESFQIVDAGPWYGSRENALACLNSQAPWPSCVPLLKTLDSASGVIVVVDDCRSLAEQATRSLYHALRAALPSAKVPVVFFLNQRSGVQRLGAKVAGTSAVDVTLAFDVAASRFRRNVGGPAPAGRPLSLVDLTALVRELSMAGGGGARTGTSESPASYLSVVFGNARKRDFSPWVLLPHFVSPDVVRLSGWSLNDSDRVTARAAASTALRGDGQAQAAVMGGGGTSSAPSSSSSASPAPTERSTSSLGSAPTSGLIKGGSLVIGGGGGATPATPAKALRPAAVLHRAGSRHRRKDSAGSGPSGSGAIEVFMLDDDHIDSHEGGVGSAADERVGSADGTHADLYTTGRLSRSSDSSLSLVPFPDGATSTGGQATDDGTPLSGSGAATRFVSVALAAKERVGAAARLHLSSAVGLGALASASDCVAYQPLAPQSAA